MKQLTNDESRMRVIFLLVAFSSVAYSASSTKGKGLIFQTYCVNYNCINYNNCINYTDSLNYLESDEQEYIIGTLVVQLVQQVVLGT